MNSSHKSRLALLCSLALFGVPAAFAGGDADSRFKKMDANGDGKISRAEHAAAAKQMFAACDANHDGIVTAAEMDAAMALQGEKPDKNEKSSAEKIQMIDHDGDGKLTAVEHEAGSEKMFGLMDKNNDGFLSKEECSEGMKMTKKTQ